MRSYKECSITHVPENIMEIALELMNDESQFGELVYAVFKRRGIKMDIQ
jgi:hypothetical protein